MTLISTPINGTASAILSIIAR